MTTRITAAPVAGPVPTAAAGHRRPPGPARPRPAPSRRGAGAIILAMGNSANTSLATELAGNDLEIQLVGDAVAPRQVDIAILDGERAGWMV